VRAAENAAVDDTFPAPILAGERNCVSRRRLEEAGQGNAAQTVGGAAEKRAAINGQLEGAGIEERVHRAKSEGRRSKVERRPKSESRTRRSHDSNCLIPRNTRNTRQDPVEDEDENLHKVRKPSKAPAHIRVYLCSSVVFLITSNRFVQVKDDPADLSPGSKLTRVFLVWSWRQTDMEQFVGVVGTLFAGVALCGQEFEQRILLLCGWSACQSAVEGTVEKFSIRFS